MRWLVEQFAIDWRVRGLVQDQIPIFIERVARGVRLS